MSDCQYFYFENGSFGSPYAWVYSSTKTFGEHGWPGEALVEVVGTAPSGNLVYRWTYNGSEVPTDIIFSNNGQSQVPTSNSFAFTNGGYYTTEGLQGIVSGNVMELSNVIKSTTNQNYIVDNDLTVVYIDKNGQRIFAKDADGSANNISRNTEGKPVPGALKRWNYDQSNWIEIVLPQAITAPQLINFNNKKLLGQTIVGKLVDSQNPKIEVTANPIPTIDTQYTPNNYVTANFLPSTNSNYFLVTPKPQEYAVIKWAVYHDGKFYMPRNASASSTQENPLHGAVSISNDTTYRDDKVTLEDLQMYEVTVIIKKKENSTNAPSLLNTDTDVDINENDAVANDWEVAIVQATKLSDDYVTDVETLNSSKDLIRTIYFNLNGIESDRPFKGVNIVVKEYTDGSRTASKIIR